MMGRFIVAFLLAVAVLASDARAQNSGSYAVGRWQVAAYQSRGQFSSCVVTVPAQSGGALGLRLGVDGEWYLLIEDADAPWSKKLEAVISWSIGKDVRVGDARVRAGIAFARLNDGRLQAEEFGRSRTASVTVDRSTYVVVLDGIDAVVRELERCVKLKGEVAGPATAQADSPPPQRAPASPVGVADQYAIGRWTVEVYKGSSGEFIACVASSPMVRNMFLGFRLEARNVWSIVVYGDDWRHPSRGRFDYSYRVDDRPVRTGRGVHGSPQLVLLLIENSLPALDELRTGRNLRIKAAGEEAEFALDGSATAIAEVERCVAQRTGAPPPTRRPVAPPAPPPLPIETPSSRR